MYKIRPEFKQLFVTKSGIIEAGERTDFQNTLLPEPEDLVCTIIESYGDGSIEFRPAKGFSESQVLDYINLHLP